jgi:spore photoproduct lyase
LSQSINVSEQLKFERIFIDQQAEDSLVARRVRQLYPAELIESVTQEPLPDKRGTLSSADFAASKRLLYLTPYRGQFFKRCPGATQKKTLTCCNYHVLNLGSQCNMNCSYCYLQSYLNTPVMKIFTNLEQALDELSEMASQHPEQPFRVGTGEVIDSLSLDPLTLYSRHLIKFFQQYPQWSVEFKTKSAYVDQFLDLPGTRNVIVSWSINPPYIIDREEHGTAPFESRLRAAEKCRDRGYRVAFHIDPMIWHPQWQDNYSFLAEEILKRFSAEDIQTISIGALRFQPEQRHIMKERFGFNSLVNQAEVFPSEGGKMRYDATLRAEMFSFMQRRLKELNPKLNVFLCMETPETWINAFEKIPVQMPELKELFRPLPQVVDRLLKLQ